MFKPINGRILVKPDPNQEEKSYSGIIVQEKVEKALSGVALTPGGEVKEGDRILFSRYGFDEFKQDNQVFYTVSLPTILGIYG